MKNLPLKAKLTASLENRVLDQNYRAVLNVDDEGFAVLRIDQEIDGAWHPCGASWYLEDLGDSDGIYIDWGQKWKISGGMLAAFEEAKQLLLA